MLVLAGGSEEVSAPSVVTQVRGNGKKNLLAALDAMTSLHEGPNARQECDSLRAIKAGASVLQGRGGRVLLMTASNPLEKVVREKEKFFFLLNFLKKRIVFVRLHPRILSVRMKNGFSMIWTATTRFGKS